MHVALLLSNLFSVIHATRLILDQIPIVGTGHEASQASSEVPEYTGIGFNFAFDHVYGPDWPSSCAS